MRARAGGGRVGGSAKEIVWTSGATEADNLAILGAAEAYREIGDQIVTCATEHPAVLDTCRHLLQRGFRVTTLPVDSMGVLDLDALSLALDDRTILVTIMTANNEVGTIHPIAEISASC
jgi:cysteine desulfurase